jgi:hypothetical protein
MHMRKDQSFGRFPANTAKYFLNELLKLRCIILFFHGLHLLRRLKDNKDEPCKKINQLIEMLVEYGATRFESIIVLYLLPFE